ncbi:MAG: hypothetical protein WC700_17760 [Gemmatimonadaceae bacterium]|jgi:hypothetical protein
MRLILPTRVTLDLTRDGARSTMRYVESFKTLAELLVTSAVARR